MRNLFLAGGGEAEDSRELDRLFAKSLSAADGFAYVPVAMAPHRYPDCGTWIESVFRPLGVRRIDLWRSLEGKSLEDLRSAGGLYIGGGDTAKLLHEVRRSGFVEALQAFVEEGRPVYGGSAGAILLGANIKTAPEASPLEFADARGLDLLEVFSVACHYTAAAREWVVAFVDATRIPVLALSERAGLLIGRAGAATAVGNEPLEVFTLRGREEIALARSVGLATLH